MSAKSLTKLAPFTLLLGALLAAPGCGNEGEAGVANAKVGSSAESPKQSVVEPGDIIARVGDEVIRFSELNTMLNSSAMVGLSIPALGTPERNQVIITLLDKAISANLIYLDAKKQGTDRQAVYTTDMNKFENAVLEQMYKERVLIGKIPVSDEEIDDYYKSRITPETELNDDLRLAIESIIRKQKYTRLKENMRERLRAGTGITINEDVLSTSNDASRSPVDVVATVGDRRITWGDVDTVMRGADYRATLSSFYVDNEEERMQRLQAYIDSELMAAKAREAGMDKDPEFEKRTAEYRKTRLINVHRNGLFQRWTPSDDELRTYFMDHIDTISVPESRKVQMVVVKTREEAESIKARIDKGEITMFQAAQQYSLDPAAKQTLGEMGWVRHGTGFPELDDFTFNLDVDVVGGPVESPAGWHLVKVLDVIDAQFQNIEDEDTRKRTLRMFLKDKFNDYVVNLRKNDFKVVVYDDELTRQFQKEADYIAGLNKKAQQAGSVTEQRQKELDKWIGKPPPPQ